MSSGSGEIERASSIDSPQRATGGPPRTGAKCHPICGVRVVPEWSAGRVASSLVDDPTVSSRPRAGTAGAQLIGVR
jgi:hypothetical protein